MAGNGLRWVGLAGAQQYLYENIPELNGANG